MGGASRITGPGDVVKMEAIENGKIIGIGPFRNPDGVIIRVDLTSYSGPLIDRKDPVGPEENDRFAIDPEVGGVVGVDID